jgi:hypothetical protein
MVRCQAELAAERGWAESCWRQLFGIDFGFPLCFGKAENGK